MSRALLTRALVATLALLSAAPAEAGGFHITIFGVRRTGMLTDLGNPDDPTALFANPAGLADLPSTQVQLAAGLSFMDINLHLQGLDPVRFPSVDPDLWPVDARGYYKADLRPESYFGVIPYLGVTQNLGALSPALKDVGVGFALYSPGAYGATFDSKAPTAFFVEKGLFLMASATVGVGWRVNKYLSVGGNVSYNYMRLGYAQKFSAIDTLTPSGQEPDDTAHLAQDGIGDLSMDYTGSDNGLGWTLSALISPTDWLSIGLVYGGWTDAHFDGPLTIGSANVPDPAQLRDILVAFGYKLPTRLRVDQAIPPTLQAGVNIEPSDRVEIGVDYRRWFYSIYDRQTRVPSYDEGPGTEPLTEAGLSKRLDQDDSWQLCAGVLWRPLAAHPQLELMAGVGFDKSPVHDEYFSIDSPSMDQGFVSIGFRELLARHWRIGLSYMHTEYFGRDVTTSLTSPPTNARVDARSYLPTIELTYVP